MDVNHTPEPPPVTHYVSLDLGSESTAAHLRLLENNVSENIDLQHYAHELRKGALDLLTDHTGVLSKRIRTRFGLRQFRQPAPLPIDHARLAFVDAQGERQMQTKVAEGGGEPYEEPVYEDAVFEYFRIRGEAFSGADINMPNPKIPFQTGGEHIIPPLGILGRKQKERYEPAELIQHMTLQMVRNFVLRSPQLRNVDPARIHFTLTVPNVYSITHKEELRAFLRAHLGLAPGAVDVLYESDAVAYFLLDATVGIENEAFRRIKSRIAKLDDVRLVTFDVGRGTTDLSLIRRSPIERDGGDVVDGHAVLGRTGRSDGGNLLSYTFAAYYNRRLRSLEHWFTEFAGLPGIPFDFITGDSEGRMGSLQGPAIGELERLIEAVKRSVSSRYEVELPVDEQTRHIDRIIDYLFQELDPSWPQEHPDEAEKLREVLRAAWVLPPRLPRPSLWDAVRRAVLFWKRIEEPPERALTRRIERYVEGIASLVDELAQLAGSNTLGRRLLSRRGHIYDPANTFVLVAGQASQFAPLRRAIESKCGEYGLDYCFLEKENAKEACCRGAITFQFGRGHYVNPNDLHGSYGLLSVVGGRFTPIDMDRLRSGGRTKVEVTGKGVHVFLFSTRPVLPADNLDLHDGSIAQIVNVEPRPYDPEAKDEQQRYSYFDVAYDPDRAEIRINGAPVREIGNFGALNESIYPKVWPDILQPAGA